MKPSNNPAPDAAPAVGLRLLTAREVAAVLRIGVSSVYRLVKTGELPAVRLGKSIRVRADVLERLINGEQLDGKGGRR